MHHLKLLTVADLHCHRLLLDDLVRAVVRHQPDLIALVGDFLHGGDTSPDRVTPAECARRLANLPCEEIICVRGNHEGEQWPEFLNAWPADRPPLIALHGESHTSGPLTLVGFPCAMGDETAYIGDREPLPPFAEEWLTPIMQANGSAFRTLWLMHEPPTGTRLTQKQSPVEGNHEWNEAIERYAPWLTVSGHDHQTPRRTGVWHQKLGQTTCVNAGQNDAGPLHYCLIEAHFATPTPSLPTKLKITAFPQGKTHDLTPKPKTRIHK